MNGVALSSATDRQQLFEQTAAKMDINVDFAEKDFWVCWSLKQIFESDLLKNDTVFRGGTSLSKVFNLIQRFSEDVDLTLARDFIGIDKANVPTVGHSSSRRNTLNKKIRKACDACVQDVVLPHLKDCFTSVLGESSDAALWSLGINPDSPETIDFSYPRAIKPKNRGMVFSPVTPVVQPVAYSPLGPRHAQASTETILHPAVRLEFGGRAENWPTVEEPVQPYAAKYFKTSFTDPECTVVAADASRTFLEKSTILHDVNHRPQEKALRPEHVRHYYDVVMLTRGGVSDRAIGTEGLIEGVIKQSVAFGVAKAEWYDSKHPLALSLVPNELRIDGLRKDYDRMQEMVFGEAPTFDEIINELGELEAKLKKLS